MLSALLAVCAGCGAGGGDDDDARVDARDAAIADGRWDVPVDAETETPDAAPDAAPDYSASDWHACGGEDMPEQGLLLPLPGSGQGPPVVTSNNPEQLTGDGLLFGTARASAARGGASFPLAEFGVYVHHVNASGATRYVQLVVTNPNDSSVTVQAWGSGYSQDQTGGLPLGGSPDYLVSDDWITEDYRTEIAPTAVPSMTPLRIWLASAGHNREIDGRFQVRASAPVYAYVVATTTDDVNEAITDGIEDAPGEIAVPGDPPPPFGREAGVYAHDTWFADVGVEVPAGPRRIAWWVNTATGIGAADVQAFPALMHYADSAAESTGMYGNVYDLRLRLRHDGQGSDSRTVRVALASYGAGAPSRFWDGAALVDGDVVTVRCTPSQRVATLTEVAVPPGQEGVVHIRAMVPGLTSIPQALILESSCP